MKRQPKIRTINEIRDLHAGDHVCCLPDGEVRTAPLLAEFIRAGLEADDRVVYAGTVEAFEKTLGQLSDLSVESRLAKGQLAFVDTKARIAEFAEPDHLLRWMKAEEAKSLEGGRDGLRLALDISSILRPGTAREAHLLYERAIDTYCRGSRCTVLCLYCRGPCSPDCQLDLLRTHPVVASDGVLFENMYYTVSAGTTGSEYAAEEYKRRLQNLANHKASVMALGQQSSVVEQTADLVMITNREGIIEYVNPAFEALTGYSFDEAVGKKPNILRSNRHSPEFFAGIWNTILSGHVFRGEIANHKKNGDLYFEQKTITPIKDSHGRITHFVSTAKDITESKRTAEDLRRTMDLLDAIIQAAPMAILSMDREGNMQVWNKGAETMFGWKKAEVLGRPNPVIPADRLDQYAAVRQNVMNGASLPGLELPCQRKDGTLLDTNTSVGPIRSASGEVVGALGLIMDTTDRKHMEAELLQHKKLESIGRLAGGIAHDFNNLLTVINSSSEMLVRDLPLGDPHRGEAEEILRAGQRAATLTRQLLAFSRRQVLKPRVINLNMIIADMEGMLQRMLGESTTLVTRIDPDLENTRADPGQMSQVIMNLAANARDAMKDGGRLTIETANTKMDISSPLLTEGLEAGPYVLLTICDTGVGMDEETLDKVFDPFFTTKETTESVGLGLPTVYGIIKQSGGHIEVASAPGCGSCFKIYLPVVKSMVDTSVGERHGAPPAGGTEPLLLVEDDEIVRRLLKRILEDSGYTVYEAGGGQEALALIARHQHSLPLLITDVTMPTMNGIELAERVKKAWPTCKVLYMSGYTDEESFRKTMMEAEIPFLQKPFTPTMLLRKIRDLLSEKA